jgi:nucleoside-diphosphate-sugar epimerase
VNGQVLITGAKGFVGSAVTSHLLAAGHVPRAIVRGRPDLPPGVERVENVDLAEAFDVRSALAGCAIVLHIAGRAHVMNDRAPDALTRYRAVNVSGTMRLARQAAEMGVHRFVFMSSVTVHGTSSPPGHPFTGSEPPAPVSPYAVSKLEAERGLQQLARKTGMAVVILRAPLVYGPGATGNWRRLVRLVRSGVPLPLASVDNQRSMIWVGNLAEATIRCMEAPDAAGRTLMVSDGEDLSTPDIIRRIAAALGRPPRLFPLPPSWVRAGATLLGRGDMADRVLGSLQVDMSETTRVLDWSPGVGVDEGIAKAVTSEASIQKAR